MNLEGILLSFMGNFLQVMTSPCFLDANLRVKHEMHDFIGIAEVKLRFVCATLKESFGRLNPICLDNLRFNARRESAQHFVILEHLDLRINSCANFQAQNDRVMNFKLDADARPRAFLQRVLLLNKLLNLTARLRCKIQHDITSFSIRALNLDFLELYHRFDHDSHGVSGIAAHLSK